MRGSSNLTKLLIALIILACMVAAHRYLIVKFFSPVNIDPVNMIINTENIILWMIIVVVFLLLAARLCLVLIFYAKKEEDVEPGNYRLEDIKDRE